jgi:hypothetical protein
MADYPPAKQRPALLAFAEAISSRADALRRDECGDWRIKGRFGHVYAVPGILGEPPREGFLICYTGPEFIGSPRGWTLARREFEAIGCKVTQDGDGEGIVFLGRLPGREEGEIIRDKLVIFKKRDVSEEERDRLRSQGFKPRTGSGLNDQGPAKLRTDDA